MNGFTASKTWREISDLVRPAHRIVNSLVTIEVTSCGKTHDAAACVVVVWSVDAGDSGCRQNQRSSLVKQLYIWLLVKPAFK